MDIIFFQSPLLKVNIKTDVWCSVVCVNSWKWNAQTEAQIIHPLKYYVSFSLKQ